MEVPHNKMSLAMVNEQSPLFLSQNAEKSAGWVSGEAPCSTFQCFVFKSHFTKTLL